MNPLLSNMDQLISRFLPLPEPVPQPTLVIVSGLPGTGKSYFSRKLAERIPSIIVESDLLRKEIFASPSYTLSESQQLFTVCHHLISELLRKGIRVIFDATNLREAHREELYHIASQTGSKLIIVQIKAPPEVVRKHFEDRGLGVDPDDHSDADWQIYERMKPSLENINRNFFVADTSRDIEPVLNKIVRELRKR